MPLLSVCLSVCRLVHSLLLYFMAAAVVAVCESVCCVCSLFAVCVALLCRSRRVAGCCLSVCSAAVFLVLFLCCRVSLLASRANDSDSSRSSPNKERKKETETNQNDILKSFHTSDAHSASPDRYRWLSASTVPRASVSVAHVGSPFFVFLCHRTCSLHLPSSQSCAKLRVFVHSIVAVRLPAISIRPGPTTVNGTQRRSRSRADGPAALECDGCRSHLVTVRQPHIPTRNKSSRVESSRVEGGRAAGGTVAAHVARATGGPFAFAFPFAFEFVSATASCSRRQAQTATTVDHG